MRERGISVTVALPPWPSPEGRVTRHHGGQPLPRGVNRLGAEKRGKQDEYGKWKGASEDTRLGSTDGQWGRDQ